MKMKQAAGLALCMLVSAWAAEPAEAVRNAAEKLAQKGSYSWTTTTKMGGNSRFEPRPWHGKTSKESGTLITTTGRNDQSVEVALKGAKGWMKTDQGWEPLEELAQGGQGQRGGFMARFMRDHKLPAEEAKSLAEQSTNLKKEGDVYSGELTKEGAQTLVMRGFRRGQAGQDGPDVSGTTRFWVKDGVLSKYEYNLKGTLRFGDAGQEFDLDRTSTVEIKDVSSTTVELPQGLN